MALDFGCGVGRLTRALAGSFEKSCGVDILEAMVTKARELNGQIGNCSFVVNNSTDLRVFPNETFDLHLFGQSSSAPAEPEGDRAICFRVCPRAEKRRSSGLSDPHQHFPALEAAASSKGLFFVKRTGRWRRVSVPQTGDLPDENDTLSAAWIGQFSEPVKIHLVKVERDLDSSPGMPGAKYYAVKNSA